MRVEEFIKILNSEFYVGVPDSQLKALCNYLLHTYGVDGTHHIIAANEGNCAAIAAGYHLATGKVPVVYMQNSGEGNIINPLASLLNDMVYAIPVIFIVGWRGEPGVHDESQHIYQGAVTLKLLEDMGVETFVLSKETAVEELVQIMEQYQLILQKGKCVAFVVKKEALTYDKKMEYANSYTMRREEIIEHIVSITGEDPIISTTGKASRELFEVREKLQQGHQYDFLTVGSMGHSSSIALGVALQKKEEKIWCIDGDGAALMHMGAMAVIGQYQPVNLVHIVLNNEAHESVGGMPTAAKGIDFAKVAQNCGYPNTVIVKTFEELDNALTKAKKENVLSLIEVKCAIGARKDLGRPTTTTIENKEGFMEFLKMC